MIEAFQWTGLGGIWEPWLYDYRGPNSEIAQSTVDGHVKIPTLEGEMIASPGDWIIKGVQGECYPCKPDIFAAIYEPVE